MKKDIEEFMVRCLACQKVKAEHQHLDGYLYPHDISTQKWQMILMDFIVNLPKTKFHHDSILVVIDKLTKVAHFIPGNTIDDAPVAANKFAHKIFKLHGFIEMIILDRDSKFTSVFWKSLHNALGTKLNMSSAYHLETDGKIERMNRFFEDMFRMYCMEQNTKWED